MAGGRFLNPQFDPVLPAFRFPARRLRFILPNEMFQLDAARVSRCFLALGPEVCASFCQCPGSRQS